MGYARFEIAKVSKKIGWIRVEDTVMVMEICCAMELCTTVVVVFGMEWIFQGYCKIVKAVRSNLGLHSDN